MNTRSKVRPHATDPIDDEDLDMLDSFSISSILDDEIFGDQIGDDDDTINSYEPLPDLDDSDGVEIAFAREPTIDELLDGSLEADDDLAQTQRNPDTSATGSFGSREDLLPPEALFPETDDD